MKRIYKFDKAEPPYLNERMLRKTLEKRKLRRQTILLTIASVLSQIAVVLLGILLWPIQPLVTLGCILYVLSAALFGGAVAIIYTWKRRSWA